MRVAITGATGFIGKQLVKKHLNLGDEVHILSRKKKEAISDNENICYHFGDLSHIDSLRGFLRNVDILYHCAAEIKDVSKMETTNIVGTKNLLKAAKNNVKHWVQLSSVGVYGQIDDGIVIETQDCNPISTYEKTKLASDLLILELAESFGMTYTIIRPSNVFGIDMPNRSLHQLILALDKRFFFFIGKKDASANYVPIENVIAALYLGATHPAAKNSIYIISNWVAMTTFIGYIAETLKRPKPKRRISKNVMIQIARIGKIIPKFPLTIARVKALSNPCVYSIEKIEMELGFKSVISLEEAIKNLVISYNNSK